MALGRRDEAGAHLAEAARLDPPGKLALPGVRLRAMRRGRPTGLSRARPSRIIAELEVADRVEAVAVAHRLGLVAD